MDTSRNTFLQFQEMYSQPPVFSVDDGLPFKLDGITIPKWIQETLKGAGNAIVPQMALKLYQIIEEIEKANLN